MLTSDCSVVSPYRLPPVWQFFFFDQIQLLCLRRGRVSTLRESGNEEALTGAAKAEVARAARITAVKEKNRIVVQLRGQGGFLGWSKLSPHAFIVPDKGA